MKQCAVSRRAVKYEYLIILISSILLLCCAGRSEGAEEGAKDVDIKETTINFSQKEFPRVAYLCVELKNNSGKSIANLNLEITYRDADDCLIKKVVLKNKLTEALPSGETRKYKIRLNGDVINQRNEEYPYSRCDEVKEFDVKILAVKFARK